MNENQEVQARKRRSSEEIKRLVLEFEASGLRQNEFCRNHGLALSILRRQLKKRRLDKGEAKEGGPSSPDVPSPTLFDPSRQAEL